MACLEYTIVNTVRRGDNRDIITITTTTTTVTNTTTSVTTITTVTITATDTTTTTTTTNNNNNNRNLTKKEAEKILNYKDLTIEIQRMWNVKTKVTPVIMGATRAVLKSLRQHLSNIPGRHEIKELQTTAVLDTAQILREVLM